MTASLATFAEPMVTDVTAKQCYPWNGYVDIACKVAGIEGAVKGLEFAMVVVMPDTDYIRIISNFWVVRGGTNSTDHAVYNNGSYRFVWNAGADVGQVLHTNMVVRVSITKERNGVQLWDGGPYWAEMNIGAKEPWECGYYFWWGSAVGYKLGNNPFVTSENSWLATDGSSSFIWFDYEYTPTYGKSIIDLQSEGWVTEYGILAPEHDAAQVQWGGGWRMPMSDEIDDLNSKCDWTWSTLNGVNGYVVRGRGEYTSASIFLPAVGVGFSNSLSDIGSSGWYWSSIPATDFGDDLVSLGLAFDLNSHGSGQNSRDCGQAIRPVLGSSRSVTTISNVGQSEPFIVDTMPNVTDVVAWQRYPWNGLVDISCEVSGIDGGGPGSSSRWRQ